MSAAPKAPPFALTYEWVFGPRMRLCSDPGKLLMLTVASYVTDFEQHGKFITGNGRPLTVRDMAGLLRWPGMKKTEQALSNLLHYAVLQHDEASGLYSMVPFHSA